MTYEVNNTLFIDTTISSTDVTTSKMLHQQVTTSKMLHKQVTTSKMLHQQVTTSLINMDILSNCNDFNNDNKCNDQQQCTWTIGYECINKYNIQDECPYNYKVIDNIVDCEISAEVLDLEDKIISNTNFNNHPLWMLLLLQSSSF